MQIPPFCIHGGECRIATDPGTRLQFHLYPIAEWCEATAHVVFHRFNAERLRAFWAAYRQETTYNLTNRNCSVVVAMALDTALEGVLGNRPGDHEAAQNGHQEGSVPLVDRERGGGTEGRFSNRLLVSTPE
jgi:hypothetical protein